MVIRSFKPTDADSVRGLIDSIMQKEYPGHEKAYRYDDLHDISSSYKNIREKFLVAEEEGHIIGTVGIKEDNQATALLRRLFVHPSHRGRGIGLMLADTAIDFCKMNDYRQVVFRATSKMKAAMSLLAEKKGFVEKERHFFEDIEIIVLSYKIH